MAQKKETNNGNVFTRLIDKIDAFQRTHKFVGFPYAVVKKYGDDSMGHQAALITYYGFLSLFPLLIVATSIVDIISQHNLNLRSDLITNINNYFPLIGSDLQSSIQSNSKTGLALAIGLVFALYGSRGIADAVRNSLDHAWAVPKAKRTGFPKNILRSIGLLTGTGVGLILTTGLTAYATSALGHAWYVRTIPIVVNAGLLYILFMYVFAIGTSHKLERKDLRVGAATAAIGLLILQGVGVALITHQLSSLSGVYGHYALVLALLFWIYLQAQVFTYAIQINVVHAYRLWPRSLAGELTPADKKTYELAAKKEAMRPIPEEEIRVTFRKK